MDKKNTILGVVFIAAGIGFMFWQSQQIETQRLEQLQQAARLEAPAGESTTPADAALTAPGESGPAGAVEAAAVSDLFKDAEIAESVTSAAPLTEETIVVLTNEYIEAAFTTRGGAIRTVSFLKTKRGERDDYVFNQDGLLPALSLSYSASDGQVREFALDYRIEAQTDDSVTFAFVTAEGMVIRRSYRIAPSGSTAEPYMIEHSTAIENGSTAAKRLETVYFNLGTARRITDDQVGANYLNVGYFDGEDAEFIPLKKLTGSKGFLGMGASAPTDKIAKAARIEWASV